MIEVESEEEGGKVFLSLIEICQIVEEMMAVLHFDCSVVYSTLADNDQ